MKTDAEVAITKLEARVAVLESCIPYIPTPIAKAEPVDGKPLRKTCLHDNGDGSFSLTLLVDVRGEDVVEAADLLKRGRALQASANYKDAPGDEPECRHPGGRFKGRFS